MVRVLISPLIYFTVFLVTFVAVVASVWLDRNGHVSGYEYPLAGIGTVLLAATVGYLGWLAATEPYATFYPLLLTTTLVGATAATVVVWFAIGRLAPQINSGTMFMGFVVIWAHAVDGVANVIGLDWAVAFGHSRNLVPKHPVNEAIVNVTGSMLLRASSTSPARPGRSCWSNSQPPSPSSGCSTRRCSRRVPATPSC